MIKVLWIVAQIQFCQSHAAYLREYGDIEVTFVEYANEALDLLAPGHPFKAIIVDPWICEGESTGAKRDPFTNDQRIIGLELIERIPCECKIPVISYNEANEEIAQQAKTMGITSLGNIPYPSEFHEALQSLIH